MANEVKFRIKMDVDGKEKIVEASADVKKLEELMARQRQGNDVKKEEAVLVAEQNGVYGKTMGYFSSVASWYKALT